MKSINTSWVSKASFQKLFFKDDFHYANNYTRGVLSQISTCHTKDRGYHCYQCNNSDCLDSHIQYHSCNNRHCPLCGGFKKDEWVENRIADLFPTPYYHVVFTVPHAWNKVMKQSPKELYAILFDASSTTLLEMSKNPDYLGATPGITTVLHSPLYGAGYGVKSWIIMYMCIVSSVVGV